MKKMVLLGLFLLTPTLWAYASDQQERYTLRDRFRGIILKSLAKTYVATTNLEKFKEQHLKTIREMDEQKFKRVYAKIYKETLADLPATIMTEYELREDLSKQEALDLIDSFDTKKKIYKAISSLPSGFVGKQHRQRSKEKKQDLPKEEKLRRSEVDRYFEELLEDPAPAPQNQLTPQ